MKFGSGALESPFPANPGNKTKPKSEDEMFREMRSEMALARIFCPFPEGSTKTFRESALIVSNRWPVRYKIEKDYDWVVTAYDMQNIVAEMWVLQESADFLQPRPLSDAERQRILDALTPRDTAWWYRFEGSGSTVDRFMRENLGASYQTASPADWFAGVTAACFWNGISSQGYISDRDAIPYCPKALVPGRKQRPVTERGGGARYRRPYWAPRR